MRTADRQDTGKISTGMQEERERFGRRYPTPATGPPPGDGTTTPHYWDCCCEEHYIRPAQDANCPACGARRGERPWSQAEEVRAAGFPAGEETRDAGRRNGA